MTSHPSSSSELDARRIGALVQALATGTLPALAGDFTWRGKPCTANDFSLKLQAIAQMSLVLLETRVVPADATAEIAGLLEEHTGVPARAGDRLAIVTVQYGDHIISWGLLIEERGGLLAWFDPSALLQLIAP